MILGKFIKFAICFSIMVVIVEINLIKISQNQVNFQNNYPLFVEKNLKFLNSDLFQFHKENSTLIFPENLTITIGIFANPEPINEIFSAKINSTQSLKERNAIFNSTYISWLNNSINSDFILEEIKNYFTLKFYKNPGIDKLKIKIDFVPLLFWQNDSIVDNILSKVNGVVFTGGDRDVDFKYEWEQYAIRLTIKIMNLQEKNDRKIPLWGICQGIEIIHSILVNTTKILEKFSSWNQMQKIEIRNFDKVENKKLSIYNFLDEKEIEFFEKEESTVHYHNLGINPDSYDKKEYSILKKIFQVSAFGYDSNGKKFINSVESYHPYNIFAVQFHPEKNPLKIMKNLREAQEDCIKKFRTINSKISLNFLIKAIEDNLNLINNPKNFIELSNSNNNKESLIKEIKNIKKIDENIVYDYKHSPIPIYLFSE